MILGRSTRRSRNRGARGRSGSSVNAAGGGNPPAVFVEPADSSSSFAWSSGTVTATGLAMGAATQGRVVVAVITSRADADLSTVSIAGVTAVKASNVRNAAATPDTSVEIWYASVPGGATGTVIATTSDVATVLKVGITLFALTGGVNGYPVPDTQNTATGALDTAGLGAAITVTRASATIGGACGLSSVGPVTWTGMTKYTDMNPAASHTSSAAYRTDSVGASVTPNATSTGASANSAFAEASFR